MREDYDARINTLHAMGVWQTRTWMECRLPRTVRRYLGGGCEGLWTASLMNELLLENVGALRRARGTRPRTDACRVRHEAGVNDDSGVRGRVGSLVDGCEECAVHDESAPGEMQRNAL